MFRHRVKESVILSGGKAAVRDRTSARNYDDVDGNAVNASKDRDEASDVLTRPKRSPLYGIMDERSLPEIRGI
jgi:hypothetical protein